MPNKLRIFIADDHIIVREGLKALINTQSDLEVIGEANDGQEAVQLAAKLQPDVVIMDVSMPNMNGLEATKSLKHSCPKTKILPLTRYSDSFHPQQMLLAGASGYVLKQSPAANLLQAIRVVAYGGTYLDPAITGKILENYYGRLPSQKIPVQKSLSEREADVLRLIAQGFSNKEVANELDISIKTVESHKAHAMKKLGLNNRVDVVRYAMLCGWLEDL